MLMQLFRTEGEHHVAYHAKEACFDQLMTAIAAMQIVIGGRDKYSINGHAAQQG